MPNRANYSILNKSALHFRSFFSFQNVKLTKNKGKKNTKVIATNSKNTTRRYTMSKCCKKKNGNRSNMLLNRSFCVLSLLRQFPLLSRYFFPSTNLVFLILPFNNVEIVSFVLRYFPYFSKPKANLTVFFFFARNFSRIPAGRYFPVDLYPY